MSKTTTRFIVGPKGKGMPDPIDMFHKFMDEIPNFGSVKEVTENFRPGANLSNTVIVEVTATVVENPQVQ